MKGKLVILLVVVLALSMILVGVSDSKALVGDSSVLDAAVSNSEVDSNEAQEEDLPSATATITITWRIAPKE